MRLSIPRIVACAAFTVGMGLAVPAVEAAEVPTAALQAQAALATPAPAVYLPKGATADFTAGQAVVQPVQYYRYRRYHRRPHWRWRHRYRGPRWRYAPPPRYGYRYRRGGGAHVRWCLNRYRSYSPRTDSYLGYDGRYHRCYSPYR